MKKCAFLLVVFSACTVSINSALADTFGSGGQRVNHRLGRYRRRRKQVSSTSPVKKQTPGINIMTKIRVASFACACLLAFYLPSTSHADVMTSPPEHSGGRVYFDSSYSSSTSLAVEFTSMTPILIEFYRTDSTPSDGIWLSFVGSGGPGIINSTGVPWAGIEFRTAWSVLAHDPLFRDEYFFFQNSSQEWLDNVFFARTAFDANDANFSLYNWYEAPYSAALTIGLYHEMLREYPLYQRDDEDLKRVFAPLQDIAQINFAPGMPETSGLSGEMHLAYQGISGDSYANRYYHVLITPIAASVPEPSTAVLVLMGAGALYLWKRRKGSL